MNGTLEPKTQRRLECMEIWGGNQAANTGVSTPGIDMWVYSRPHEQSASGGDVHYVSLCGGGVITRFILADVSGHGASVAAMARSLRDLMRRNINRKRQDRLVEALNREFTELARLKQFATAVVATYLATTRRLTISNAGHPRPFWHEAATGQWSILAPRIEASSDRLSNLPLGIDGDVSFSQVDIDLGKEDFVLFYTDALVESTDASGQQLGESGLLELVRGLDVHDPNGMAESLVHSLEQFRGGKPAEDDLTFLLLHHNSAGRRRLSLTEKLDVYAKVFGLKRF